ncbi:POK9 protein, partial [Loxia leucoptera]|nr:POK9 protein [Loxia leucoptera]
GSLSMDLATTIDGALIDNKSQKIPTGIKGPVMINYQLQGVLLLGCSSSGLKGLIILPGLIDRDYEGEISIVVQTPFPPMHIPKGSRIAQLVPMQHLTDAAMVSSPYDHGDGGFGSTGGLTLLTVPMDHRPLVTAILQ